MGKKDKKEKKSKQQKGICEVSGKALSDNPSLTDADRIIPKAQGGGMTDSNTRIVDPVEHMNSIGTLRIREPEIETLKCIIDDREQVRKMYQKINNQLLAYQRRTDNLHQITLDFLNAQLDQLADELKIRDSMLTKTMRKLSKTNPFIRAALGVKGIGPVTVAYCMTYIDLEKARHASCLWSYTGLHKASHERYEKGVASGGNKSLRTVLYTMADSQLKTRGAYRGVYDNTKARLEQSEKITKSRNTQGQLLEMMWKDTKPGHRHGAGLRNIMKHFLADYWMIGRRYYGLPTSPLYPEAILGGTHKTIQPEERGWKLEM